MIDSRTVTVFYKFNQSSEMKMQCRLNFVNLKSNLENALL